MAHTLSAKKRIRQNESHRARNRWRKRGIQLATKEYLQAIHDGQVEAAEKQLAGLYKLLDKTASTPTIHKNKASRTKSRLAARLNALKAQQASA